MSDSTIKFYIDLDPEELQHHVAGKIVQLGVEEALREGISNWAMTHWIENAVRKKVSEIVANVMEPVIAPLIEKALKEHMTEEWLSEAVQELVQQRLSN